MMHPSDTQWWRSHSGDYVLGLLTNAERLVFERIMPVEPELQEYVAQWRETLQPMSDALPPIQPPEHILPALIANLPTHRDTNGALDSSSMAQVGYDSSDNDATQDYSDSQNYDSTLDNSVSVGSDMVVASAETDYAYSADSTSDRSQVVSQPYQGQDESSAVARVEGRPRNNESAAVLADGTAFMNLLDKKQDGIDGWRSFAGLATVACLLMSILGWMGFQKIQNDKAEPTFDGISIVQNDEAQTLWVVDSAAESKKLRVTAITPPALDEGLVFELWMVKPNDGGVVSMGLLPTKANVSKQFNAHRFSGEAESFSVSIESAGGSPESIPTGSFLYQGKIQSLSD